ncbi:MAG: GAF domain-containing protein [Armatimonadota bacterium]|nr:GAF domain-containing protein [Armatimonadota bacterium]
MAEISSKKTSAEIENEGAHPVCLTPELLARAVRLIASSSDLSHVLQTTLEEAILALGASRGFLAIVDHDRGELLVNHTVGHDWDEEKRRMRLKVSEETGRGITSHVAATGKPYRSGNVLKDPYYIPYFDDVRSELAVPLIDSNRRIRGVINVESSLHDAFGKEHEDLLMALANVAAAAMLLADHRAREYALVQLGKELNAFSGEPIPIQKIIGITAEALKFEESSLFLIDRQSGNLTLRASRGALSGSVGRASYQMGEGLTGWVAKEGQPIRTTSPKTDPRWRGLHAEMPPEEVGAFMAVPIVGRESVLGVFRMMRRRSPYKWFRNAFTQDDESVMMIIANQVGIALENMRLLDRLVNAERMAAWGEMSARSAHMIGNHVFGIKGDINELEYLISEGKLEPVNVRGIVGNLRKGIYRLEEILSEFREFLKADQLTLGECNLNDVVKQAIEQSFPKRSNIELSLELAKGLPKIEADPDRLLRCFSELVENSVNFQSEGGELAVSTGKANFSLLPATAATRSGKYVQVVFEDKGPGVTQEEKQRIFDPFFSTRAKGMGLGLSIVKSIVEAHKGRIYEVGKPGEGAKFVILLPYNGRK